MHGDVVCCHCVSDGPRFRYVIASSDWNPSEFPDGDRCVDADAAMSAAELIGFLERGDDFSPSWSTYLLVACEEAFDSHGVLTADALSNVMYDSDVSASVKIFYEGLATVITDWFRERGVLPDLKQWSEIVQAHLP